MGTSTILRPIACVIFSVAVGALSSHQVLAQVVIREGVTVGHAATVEQSGTEATSMTMPFDGWLDITYGPTAFSIFNPIATSELLIVSSQDTLVALEEFIDSRWTPEDTSSSACEFGSGDKYTFQPDTTNNVWRASKVREGQVVVLSTSALFPSAIYTQPTDSTWVVQMLRSDFCAEMRLSVEAVRDSLDIEFSPAADEGVSPEPGLEITVKATVRDAGSSGRIRFEISNYDYPETPVVDELIKFLNGPDTTLTLEPVDVEGDTAVAHLIVLGDLGAVNVTVTYESDPPAKSNHRQIAGQSKTRGWPEDIDIDGISDEWEDKHGGRCLSDPLLHPVPGCDDRTWDRESISGIRAVGDGITKVREYQGARINGVKHQTHPRDSMDIYVDHAGIPHGDWVLERAASLGLAIHEVSGLKQNGVEVEPGNSHLEWGKPAEPTGSVNYIVLKYVSVPDQDDLPYYVVKEGRDWETHFIQGKMIENSTYPYNGLNLASAVCKQNPLCQLTSEEDAAELVSNPQYAWADPEEKSGAKYEVVKVATTTLDNFWAANSIDLEFNHVFHVLVASGDGYEFAEAEFDASGSGLVNPMPRLRLPGSGSGESRLLGMTRTQHEQLLFLHEFGHSLGMWPGGDHPESSETPMGVGFGTHFETEFTAEDKRQINLKRIGQ